MKKEKKTLSIKVQKFFKSFVYAFNGLISGFAERNMRVHGLAFVVVVSGGLFFGLSQLEWIVVLILIAMVWSAELSNTAIEELANITRDELKLSYAATRRARDTAAAAVLVKAMVAAIIGLWIFWPKILTYLSV